MIKKREWCAAIIDCLEDVTYDSPMSVSDIAAVVGINDDPTHRRTRGLILDAMSEFNVPIGSDRRGFYTIRTAQEMQRYLNSLLQRQMGITQRIEKVYNAFLARG